MRTRRRYERPPHVRYHRPPRRVGRSTNVSSTGTLLLLGIIFLIAGFILLSNEIIETFYSIAMIIAGGLTVIVIVVSFIAKKFNKKLPNDETEIDTSMPTNNETQSAQTPNVTYSNTQNVNSNQDNEKIICKYCSCKYDNKKSKCPYCGAPQSK